MRIALALASVGMTALLAEFAVRAVMPAGRLLSPTAIEVFAERAARESTMISADDELGHAPVLGGPWYDERGALRGREVGEHLPEGHDVWVAGARKLVLGHAAQQRDVKRGGAAEERLHLGR